MNKAKYYFEMSKTVPFAKATPKIYNYLKYKILKKTPITNIKKYTPQIFSVMVTKRCNLNCEYCNAAKLLDKESMAKDATIERFKTLFSNPLVNRALLVDLLGGEPLIVKDFMKIVHFLHSSGHITNTSTNGILLADRIMDLKKSGISRINVSIYDANRRILEKTLGNINSVFPVHTSFVLLNSEVEKNPNKIIETVRFAKESGCKSLRFFMYRPMGLNPLKEEVILSTSESYRDLQHRINAKYSDFCLWPAMVIKDAPKRVCPQLWQRLNCDLDGNVVICCGTDRVLKGANSNIFDAEPNRLYNHPTLVALRRQLLNPSAPLPSICQDCNLINEPGW